MPRGDRTGPAGLGQMTGRGAGYCTGFNAPGYTAGGGGLGFGRGIGRRFCSTGFRSRPRYGAFNGGFAEPVNEKELLSSQADFLSNQLNEIKKRLENLDKN